jgi:hypothetical protein
MHLHISKTKRNINQIPSQITEICYLKGEKKAWKKGGVMIPQQRLSQN